MRACAPNAPIHRHYISLLLPHSHLAAAGRLYFRRFDHHCLFLNNDVSGRNHRWFLLFLFSHVYFCAYASFMLLWNLQVIAAREQLWEAQYMVDHSSGGRVLPASLWMVSRWLASHHTFLWIMFVLATVMIPILAGFAGFHLMLACRNQTTNERHKRGVLRSALRGFLGTPGDLAEAASADGQQSARNQNEYLFGGSSGHDEDTVIGCVPSVATGCKVTAPQCKPPPQRNTVALVAHRGGHPQRRKAGRRKHVAAGEAAPPSAAPSGDDGKAGGVRVGHSDSLQCVRSVELVCTFPSRWSCAHSLLGSGWARFGSLVGRRALRFAAEPHVARPGCRTPPSRQHL